MMIGNAFLEIAGGLVDQGVLEVHALCLMPNHYHLLLTTPHGELGRWMRYLNGDYLMECSRYIHLNPNRAKLTRPAERYRWSSYRNYVGGRTVAPWVETGLVLAGCGGDRKRYQAYVETGKGEKQVSPLERAVAGLTLGSEAFIEGVRKRLKGKKPTGEEPAAAKLLRLGRADPALVEEAVAEVFADVSHARQRRLLLVAQRLHSRLRPSEIARRYNRSPAAVTMAVKRLNVEAEENPELAKKLTQLATKVKS